MAFATDVKTKYGALEDDEFVDRDLPATLTSPKQNVLNHLLTLGFIALWWFFCGEYNILNKLACKAVPAPFTIAAIQLSTGWFWFIPLWLTGVRARPSIFQWSDYGTKLAPQGFCHCLVHVGAVLAMNAGAVSFCHIVKAFEPVTTSVLSILFMKHFFSIPTYLTLIPIVGGVGLASFASPAFNWFAFGMAMVSNVGASLRGVWAKKTMVHRESIGTNLTPANLYAIITIFATLLCWPLALAFEGTSIVKQWGAGASSFPEGQQPSNLKMAYFVIGSSVFYYTFNEIAFFVLGRVSQLTHSVSNTMKRLYIIGRSAVSHEGHLGLNTWMGSLVAILGTLLFSLSKNKYG